MTGRSKSRSGEHLSYTPLIFYRSQHEHQSWLAALTTILDTCALLLVGFEGISVPTARFTFAIARHTAVDLAQSVQTSPLMAREERLSPDDFTRMRDALAAGGLRLRNPDYAERHLAELRRFYEPFVNALASHLQLNLPPWIALTKQPDDWQTSAWDHFVDWTPETINNIMRSVAYQKKKLFARPEGVLNAQSHPVQQDEQRA
ncbi:MAG: hypothetical protein IMW89_08750 [Ktedonobacteraceae bacterium]|nr:hypothetical protein [Ktedonobacteraceae bacterium]